MRLYNETPFFLPLPRSRCFYSTSAYPLILLYGIIVGVYLTGRCPPVSADEQNTNEFPAFQSVADIGIVKIDDDLFISVTALQRFQFNGFRLVLSGPLRLRIVDKSPSDYERVLRAQDWDEPSDFARIIPVIGFTKAFENGSIDVNAGSITNISLGTGAIATHYFNSTDMDTYQGGFRIDSEYRSNGIEFLLDNLIAPSVLVGRAVIAPIGWFSDAKWAERLYLGFSFGADLNAPLRAYSQDSKTLTIIGGEVGGTLAENEHIRIDPALCIMAMDGDIGVHFGGQLRWTLSSSNGLALLLRSEYRYSGSDYHPGVFNLFYDFNRFHYGLSDAPPNTTFADQQSYGADLPSAHGLVFDLMFEWRNRLQFGGLYDREGKNRRHWAMFYVYVSPIEGYRLGALFAGQDIEGGSNIFSKNSIFSIEARGRLWRPIDVFLYFTRRWREIETAMQPANEFGGGIGVGASY